MQKSKIEWTDYTVNPVKGYCPMACPYCYARRMYDRFRWDKTIRYDDTSWFGIVHLPPSRIFVGSTIELFGDWIITAWMNCILDQVKLNSQHTFIFLTKKPQNLGKWSPFPPNTWVGVSATTDNSTLDALLSLMKISAKVKFISFEPLHGHCTFPWGISANNLDKKVVSTIKALAWIIIGAETGNRKGKPPLEQVQGWAREIIKAADEAGVPVFTKDNLKLPANEMRREWPKP